MKQQGFLTIFFSAFLAALLFITTPTFAKTEKPFSQRADVAKFINQMVTKHQFKRNDLVKLFDQVKVQKKILHNIAKPYEAKPWHVYRKIFLNQKRIELGAKFWREHETLLKKAEQQYGVPAQMIVAILGVETYYGQRQGSHRVLDALSTLAFDYPKRSRFFRRELSQFLLLTREQKLNPLAIQGSYAGAIGQPQFMPSSYRHYAVDYTGSGQADLLNNTSDVIASVANYFNKHGWQANQPVVEPAVRINKARWVNFAAKRPKYRIKTLEKYGYEPTQQPEDNPLAGVIKLKTENKPEYWIGFNNFYVITRYNTSKLYAMAVYQLSQRIMALKQQEDKVAMEKQHRHVA